MGTHAYDGGRTPCPTGRSCYHNEGSSRANHHPVHVLAARRFPTFPCVPAAEASGVASEEDF